MVLTEKEKLTAIVVIDSAKNGETIYYSDIMKYGISREEIGHFLADIGDYCKFLGLPLLPSIVVRKNTGKVSSGFERFVPNFDSNYKVVEEFQQEVWNCKNWDKLTMECKEALYFNEEKENGKLSVEGESRSVKRTTLTRNGKLRKKCLEKYGYKCGICGLDPTEKYGIRFRNIIQVHHLNPVANGVRVTTLDDLIAVCPNCHYMIHSKGRNETYDAKEIEKIVKLVKEDMEKNEERESCN